MHAQQVIAHPIEALPLFGVAGMASTDSGAELVSGADSDMSVGQVVASLQFIDEIGIYALLPPHQPRVCRGPDRRGHRSPHQLGAQAQEPWRTVRQNDHIWLAVTYDQPVSPRWAVLGDIQWRRTDGLSKPQQFMFRNTLTYKLADGLRLGGGVNYGATAPMGNCPPPARCGTISSSCSRR